MHLWLLLKVPWLQYEQKMIAKAKEKLQMPPYLPITPDEPLVLDKCPEMQGFTDYNYIFTDISIGKEPLVREIFKVKNIIAIYHDQDICMVHP